MIAQTEYAGARIAVFEVALLQQKNQMLSLRCHFANTGLQPVGGKKTASELVVELDTIGLPGLLRGHEAAIAEAARRECPKLRQGEVSAPVWLTVHVAPRVWQGTGCANLVFDTAFVEQWSARTMRLHFFVKNTGNAPASLFGKKIEPLVNVYFVSGSKLTRGAIPAGTTSITKGRETLDGLLFPGEILEGTVDISLKDRTRFSPNIALEFDPAQVIDECGPGSKVWIIVF